MRFAIVETTRQAWSFSPLASIPDDHRHERRGDGARGDELEDQVRDPERGEEARRARRWRRTSSR